VYVKHMHYAVCKRDPFVFFVSILFFPHVLCLCGWMDDGRLSSYTQCVSQILQMPSNIEHRSLWRLPKSGIVAAKRARYATKTSSTKE
jgi:hypothetical protein